MTNEIKFYLYTDADCNLEFLNKMLSLISKNKIEISSIDDCYQVSGVSEEGFCNLQVSLMAMKYDLRANVLNLVIVPVFDQRLLSIIRIKATGVFSLYDIVIRKYKNDELDFTILYDLFKKVPKNLLITAKNYIALNGSILKTSRVMFTHRNTINYRINRFINKTGINIKDTRNAMFVYFVLQTYQTEVIDNG